MMAFPGNGFGQIAIEPTTLVRTAVTTVIQQAAAPVYSAIATAVGVPAFFIAAPLAIAYAVISFVVNKRAARQAKIEAERIRVYFYRLAIIEAGVQFLIMVGYRRELAGPQDFETMNTLRDNWNAYSGDPKEENRKRLVDFLRSLGYNPTRFVGPEKVFPEEELPPKKANPAEKVLTLQGLLKFGNYAQDRIANIPSEFGVKFYDAIFSLGDVTTDEEVMTIAVRIENLCLDEGFNPIPFFKAAFYGETQVPLPTGSSSETVAQVSYSAPESEGPTLQAEPEIVSLMGAGMPTWGWFLVAGIALSLFSGKDKKTKKRQQYVS